MRGSRTLRSRLFFWFFGAILLAIATSALVVGTTRPEGTTGVEAAARHMAARLADDWNDPEATRAYVAEVRDVTGFDVELVRDPHALPPRAYRAVERGVALMPVADERVLVPVVRGGKLLGGLKMDRFGVRPPPRAWWRVALALFAVMAALSAMASRVANVLARPLEQLAGAADRFGGGDLGHRADVVCAPGWVAREVRHVAVSFNRMADRVEAMVRGQRELLGAISHELRSPLGRARIALEIGRDRLESAPRDAQGVGRALDDVEAQLGVIDGILGDLLDVTRAGLADLRRETLVVLPWLQARVAEEPTPPPIVVEAGGDVTSVRASFDPALLARTVHNLLVNARAHGHPPERPLVVRVELRRPAGGDRLRVTVCDEGPGFAPGLAERAFEPFVRGDSARARPGAGAGYGLGLAIVRRIVEAHGGRVFAGDADSGKGAAVGFDLPVSPAAG